MSTLTLTLLLAFLIVILAICALAFSWIFTGKVRIQFGACGKDPTKTRKDQACDSDMECGLCSKPKEKEINKHE